MHGEAAVYMGKVVDKKTFRVFVYSPEGAQKLVESWESYQNLMASGLWFSTKEEAKNAKSAQEDKSAANEPLKVRKAKKQKADNDVQKAGD